MRKGTYNGKEVAVKTLLGSIEQQRMQREPLYMTMVKGHPRFVTLYGICLKETETLLVMEYVAGGSLFDFLHKTKEELKFPNAINLLHQAAQVSCQLI